MTAKIPISHDLLTAAFSVAHGRSQGLGRRRMDGRDLRRPFHGIRTASPPDTVETLCRSYLPSLSSGAVFSGSTAALLLDAPLPRRLEVATSIHVTVPLGAPRRRGKGIVGHVRVLRPEQTSMRRGLPITDPVSTWCDLARELSLDDLVAVGDYLIHHRRPFTSTARLGRAVETMNGCRGVALLREALPLLDARSESRRESRLRLVLVQGGITGIRSNHWIELPRLGMRYRVDFAIPELKVAIEYQSDYHRDPVQWRADMTRISRLEAEGWAVIQVNSDDLADPAELLARIRLVILRRS